MDDLTYLECEKHYIFLLLIFVSGFYGAYALVLKGGVFSNAQTANMVLFGISIGTQNFSKAKFILLSMAAYFIGTMLSEQLAFLTHKIRLIRWDTFLIAFEIMVMSILGLLPASTPDIIFQIAINFVCAMQFNTFRQSEGIPMATTFITNHVRQTGSYLVRWLRKTSEKEYLSRVYRHLSMIISFVCGAMLCAFLGQYFKEKTLLFVNIFLGIIFIDLLLADLTKEKKFLGEKPRGH